MATTFQGRKRPAGAANNNNNNNNNNKMIFMIIAIGPGLLYFVVSSPVTQVYVLKQS